MASVNESCALEWSGELLQTHDKRDRLCLKLNTELVEDTLSQILREDVENHNCMEPPGELSLLEEVADFAAISIEGPVMTRAMDQLGDLYESLVCSLFKYCQHLYGSLRADLQATDKFMRDAVDKEISQLHEEFDSLVTFSFVDKDSNGVLDRREVRHMLKYIISSTFSEGSLQSVMDTVCELIHSRFNMFARGRGPRLQLGARVGAAVITNATKRWIRFGSLLSFVATVWKRFELHLMQAVDDVSHSIFDRMDLDGDGGVTLEEFTATWKEISRSQLHIPDVVVHLAYTVAAAIIKTVIAIDSAPH